MLRARAAGRRKVLSATVATGNSHDTDLEKTTSDGQAAGSVPLSGRSGADPNRRLRVSPQSRGFATGPAWLYKFRLTSCSPGGLAVQALRGGASSRCCTLRAGPCSSTRLADLCRLGGRCLYVESSGACCGNALCTKHSLQGRPHGHFHSCCPYDFCTPCTMCGCLVLPHETPVFRTEAGLDSVGM